MKPPGEQQNEYHTFFFKASSGDSSLSTPTKSLHYTRSVLNSFNDGRDSNNPLDIQATANVDTVDKTKPVCMKLKGD